VQFSQENIRKNRLQCPIEDPDRNLFFSLVDYRNNLFTSNDPKKIMEFYDGFENRDQLIQWMKERPKGVSYIHEVEGDKDIIVVIPTADFNGKYARECRDNIFKGLHMVFVESGIGNFYFNYAHNCNVGIKKAMEYHPKWVVVSNDDMYKVDDISALREGLKYIDNKSVGIAHIFPPNIYYSVQENVSKIRKTRYIFDYIFPKISNKKFFYIKRKFSAKFVISGPNWKNNFFYRKLLSFRDTISFSIFSSQMLSDLYNKFGFFYDEAFINCHEESDLVIRVYLSNWSVANVHFIISPIIGGSLGVGKIRLLRDQSSGILFSYKMEKLFNEVIKW